MASPAPAGLPSSALAASASLATSGVRLAARATTPEAMGAANKVPLLKATPAPASPGQPRSWSKPGSSTTATQSPGATTSTLPKEEKPAISPASSVAPTETTPGKEAGYWGMRSPVLPAEATTTLPSARTASMASRSVWDHWEPPRLRLTTSTSSSAAIWRRALSR